MKKGLNIYKKGSKCIEEGKYNKSSKYRSKYKLSNTYEEHNKQKILIQKILIQKILNLKIPLKKITSKLPKYAIKLPKIPIKLSSVKKFILQNKSKLKVIIPTALLTPILTISIIYSVNTTKGYKISVDDEYICTVKTTNSLDEILNEIKSESKEAFGTDIIIPNNISYEDIFFAGRKITTHDEIKSSLKQSITLLAKAFEINVDGKTMGFLKDKQSAEEVLNKIKAPYIKDKDDINSFSFLEDVKIIEKEITVEQLKNADDVYNCISMQNDQVKTYIVKDGDTISEIAENFSLKVQDIKKANPDIDVDKISIDQKISLTVPRYVINVVKKDYKNYEESIPFEKQYEDNNELYKGQTKVKVDGVEGLKLVKSEIVSINGIVEAINVVDEEIMEAPKDAIVLRGTKERPRTLAYGEFIMPSRGSISSRFGERWGSQHTGVDIAVPRGTPNKAADGGLVTFTGWSGGYGKLVIIDYENGYATYYAHNDTITVKKGQRVARGDTVGTAGTTGNANGPHLHFEVRKNGVPVNPMNCFK